MTDRISWWGVPWWAWALIAWGTCFLITVVVVVLIPSNAWELPKDKLDVGTLTDAQCKDDAGLTKLGMLLTEGVPNVTQSRKEQCEYPNYSGAPVPSSKVPLYYAGAVVEFENTWSNFAYILAGILILFSRPRLLGIAVGVNFCLLGLFSWLYHASLRIWTQAFDVSWIYALLLSLIAYAAESAWKRYRAQDRRPGSNFNIQVQGLFIIIPILVGLWVGILKAQGEWGGESWQDSTTLTAILLGILGLLVIFMLFDSFWLSPFDDDDERRAPHYRWNLGHWFQYVPVLGLLFRPFRKALVRGLEQKDEWLGDSDRALFAAFIVVPSGLSFVCKFRDMCGQPWCSPHAFFQGHALWHIFGAVSLWCVYDFLAQASSSKNDTILKLGAFRRAWDD
jgi:hypothetical protein